jgi:hypothetical protein
MSRATKNILNQAEKALAAESEQALLATVNRRFSNPKAFLLALHDFDGCQYWRDAGCNSMAEYGVKIDRTISFREWVGWRVLLRVPLEPEVMMLIKQRKIIPERMAALRGVLSRYTWRTWLYLSIHLSARELVEAAAEWGRMSKTGMRAGAIFVPLWVPEEKYHEIFGLNRGTPAWLVLESYLQEKAKG